MGQIELLNISSFGHNDLSHVSGTHNTLTSVSITSDSRHQFSLFPPTDAVTRTPFPYITIVETMASIESSCVSNHLSRQTPAAVQMHSSPISIDQDNKQYLPTWGQLHLGSPKAPPPRYLTLVQVLSSPLPPLSTIPQFSFRSSLKTSGKGTPLSLDLFHVAVGYLSMWMASLTPPTTGILLFT